MSTTSDLEDPLHPLMERCVEAWQAGGPAAVDRFLDKVPAHATRLRQALQTLLRAGLLEDDDPPELPASIGGHRVLGLLGRGGMGAVFLAADDETGRQVAIKVVHPQLLWYSKARERFAREVRILARLHHRGIVPVYRCGDDHGVPFFVMEYVPGRSLAAVLAGLAGRAPATLAAHELWGGSLAPGGTGPASWWRAAAEVGLQIAEALQHAHQHGIVHRDVKPSNVLLAADGSARLLDFGLARAESDEPLTRSHSTLGSEPYMAPEQLGEVSGPIDARSDVFSLGATLYELLALRPPFGSGGPATRDRVRAGDCEPLRRLLPEIPRDLAAICHVALDPERRRRYATPGAMADDLRALLDGRPVQARPLGAPGRLLRAARRRPWTVAALATAAALAVGTPTLLASQQFAAAQRIEAALRQAETSRDHALAAIDRMLAGIAQHRLFDQPEAEAVRRSLLEDAATLQQEMLAAQPTDGQLQRQSASIQRRLAQICRWLGDAAAAERHAAAGLAALVDQPGLDPVELALLLSEQSRLAHNRGDIKTAHDALTRALAMLADAAADGAPGRSPQMLQRLSAELQIELAILDGLSGDDEAANRHIAAALEVLGLLPTDRRTQAAIGRGLAQAAKAATMRNRLAQAVHFADASVAAYTRAIDADSGNWDLAASRAAVEVDRAKILHLKQDHDAALPSAQHAHGALTGLVANHPRVVWLRHSLADAKIALADALGATGSGDEQRSCLDEAIALYRGCLLAEPRSRANQEKLAVALGSRAMVARGPDEAGPLLDEAQSVLDELLEAQPRHPSIWHQNMVTRMLRAHLARLQGDAAAEIVLLDGAVALARQRAAGSPREQQRVAPVLGQALLARADAAARDGDGEGAAARLREAVATGHIDRASVESRPELLAAASPTLLQELFP